jgi:regulator of sirC expression with transglutaminase-like and TPR domain
LRACSYNRWMSEAPVHPFDEIVQMPERDIRLASAALLFATDAYPHLEIGRYLSRLDCLAHRVESRAGRTPFGRLAALRQVICVEEEYRGNKDSYYDPRNSYLNEVLDRHLGIPITLSALWLDVAWRLGWPLAGVNFPGHFLLRYEACSGPIYIDAFEQGAILSECDLRKRLSAQLCQSGRIPPEFLATAGTKAVLMRMLNNLLGIYLQQCNWQAAEPILARQVALCPEDADLWCLRGQIYLHLHQCERAVACLEHSLELTGCHPGSATVQRYLLAARKRLAESN